jgi:hypothetical protein
VNPYGSRPADGPPPRAGRAAGGSAPDARAGRAAGPTAPGWGDSEPTLRRAIWRATLRLLHRSRASWPIWTGLVVLGCAGITWWKWTHPAPYATTVVFRISDTDVGAPPETVSARALRTYVFDLAFSHSNLARIAAAEVGPGAGVAAGFAGDPAGATSREPVATGVDPVTSLIDAMSLEITESDLVEDRDPTTPPPSVRMQLTFRARAADVSWNVAHALADLVMTSERARRQRSASRGEALGPAARGVEVGGRAAAAEVAAGAPGDRLGRAGASPSSVARDVASVLHESAESGLTRRALEANQGLRFELVDPGQYPGDQFRSPLSLIVSTLLAFPAALLAAALLAGAFDPRVLDSQDLMAMGVVVLGRVDAVTRV